MMPLSGRLAPTLLLTTLRRIRVPRPTFPHQAPSVVDVYPAGLLIVAPSMTNVAPAAAPTLANPVPSLLQPPENRTFPAQVDVPVAPESCPCKSRLPPDVIFTPSPTTL